MRKIVLVMLMTLAASATFAQANHAFYDDVQTIKKYDNMFKPPVHPILFIGSSSIRKWDDMQDAFPGYRALNRGIGGAVINDIIYYLDDLVFKYEPRQIVIYVGENDLVAGDETADTILNRTVRLYRAIRAKMPDVPIAYISFKPSPSRDKYVQKAIDANLLIRKFLDKEQHTVFIDIFPLMLKDGKSRPELFVEDMLHMNAQGYAIWDKAVKPFLVK